MLKDYKDIFCVHSFDESTKFLAPFKNVVAENYVVIEPFDESLEYAIEKLKSLERPSLIIFLGHGYSHGIYSPESEIYKKKVFVDLKEGEEFFRGHDLILLSCRSADFIKNLTTFNHALGFGNIISSVSESSAEAEVTGHFRNLEEQDIDYFNAAYVAVISKCVQLLVSNKLSFKNLEKQIHFYINQQINIILRKKDNKNRVEIAKLLFEFRDDISYRHLKN